MSDRVHHPEHGPGEIVTLRRGGRVAIVDFDSRPMPTHVALRECTQIGEDGSESAVGTSTEMRQMISAGPRFEGTREQTSARRTLEAMRLGVVPSTDLDVYTVGRDVELGLIESDLDRFPPPSSRQNGAEPTSYGTTRAILGDYGTGKTHLLELIRRRALDRNFLVGRVVLDPRETKPNLPKRIYREVVRSLTYPERRSDGDRGLRPLFEEAVKTPRAFDQFNVGGAGDRKEKFREGMHLYVTPALAYAERLIDEDSLEQLESELSERLNDYEALGDFGVESYLAQAKSWVMDWIEGRPTMSTTRLNDEALAPLRGMPHLYSLMDFRPWARIYGYLLSGISALARSVGYRGLVVLVDEAERYSLLSKENREYARFVIQALSIAAVGDRGVPFDSDALENLGGWGVQQDLPPRYNHGSSLYSVFAMTPNEEGVATLESAIPDEKITELSPFDDHDYRRLASKVADFYASAYPDWVLSERLVNRLTKLMEESRRSGHIGNPRQAMKFIVELLDIARIRPEALDKVAKQLERDVIF